MVLKSINPLQKASITGISFKQNIIEKAAAGRPENIAILAQYQTGKAIVDYVPDQVSSAGSVGAKYGYGSPAHLAAMKVFPINGDGAICPVYMIPVPDPGTSTAAEATITVTGAATGSFTGYLVYNESILEAAASATKQIANNAQLNPAKPPRGLIFDGYVQKTMPFTVISGMDVTAIAEEIVAQVTANTELPFTATNNLGVVTLTMKSKLGVGETVYSIVDEDLNAITAKGGVTIVETVFAGGAGVVDITDALTEMTAEFRFTRVINQYTDSTNLDRLQAWGEALRAPDISQVALVYNGYLYPEDGALGTVDVDAVIAYGDGRRDDGINVIIPGTFDLVTPNNTDRDLILKAGISNTLPRGSNLSGYQLWDVFTFYHPENIDEGLGEWQQQDTVSTKIGNIADDLEKVFRTGEQYKAVVLMGEADQVDNIAARKISDFKATLNGRIDAYVKKAWITDAAYAKENSIIVFDDINPDRVNFNIRVKIPGVGRVYDVVLFSSLAVGER